MAKANGPEVGSELGFLMYETTLSSGRALPRKARRVGQPLPQSWPTPTASEPQAEAATQS